MWGLAFYSHLENSCMTASFHSDWRSEHRKLVSPPLFIEVPVSSQKSEHWCMCVYRCCLSLHFSLVLELGTVVCFVVHKILLEYKSNIFIGFRFIVYTKRHRAPLKRYTTVLYIDLSIILPVSSNNPALQYSILL